MVQSLPIAGNRDLGGKGQSPFTIPAATGTFVYTNPFTYNLEVIVSGGTVTAISITRGGTTIAAGLLSGTFILAQNDSITITNTIAPTVAASPLPS